MKSMKIIAIALCLNTTVIQAGFFDLEPWCPIFAGLAPICIKQGLHLFNKANNVENARKQWRERQDNTPSTEENLESGPVNERIPYGYWFFPTYEATRRKQGCAWIAAGTAMCASALYTTGTVGYQLYNADKQE